MIHSPRILLVDPSESARRTLAERLRLQGFIVNECRDGAEGAVRALEEPPAAVVADLTMPSISGVQLCRLLKSEGGTADIPVVLRGPDGRRNHFWSEQCGAYAYVVKGRMGQLVRALRSAIEAHQPDDFFVQRSAEGIDVRDRIAAHLDAALFDSVVAAELRRLGTSESFDRLVDLLSQFVSQVTTYRWLAVSRRVPARLGVHTHSQRREVSVAGARAALGVADEVPVAVVEDDDAVDEPDGPDVIIEPIPFGEQELGVIALAPKAPAHASDPLLVKTIARELGAALRMATLVEESRYMATTDALTGLVNRRAFMDWAAREQRRSARYDDPLSVVLLDVDHFKHINDHHSHAAGDVVLAAVGRELTGSLRSCDVVARWGGEEFVLALPSTPLSGAVEVAERARQELENAQIVAPSGGQIAVTASFGVAQLRASETIEQLIDRADRAMYEAKSSGRNRVHLAQEPPEAPAASGVPANDTRREAAG
ncbi:MAG: diguanylate cyclase [Polyangiales bacterium]